MKIERGMNCVFKCMACLSLCASSTSLLTAGTVADNFDIAKDYSTKNVAGTIWDGVMFNDGPIGGQNGTLLLANATITNAGRLTLSSSNGSWENNDADGFLLYRNVSGDFTATVQVTSANNPSFHDMGLMARVANAADAGAGEDYVAGRYFAFGNATSLRSVNNGATTNTDVPTLHAFLKLERVGDLFTYTRADDSAFLLNVVTSSVSRTDLAGLPLQVGIWQATFNGNVGTATFDNFSLTADSIVTAAVPEPSSIISMVLVGFVALFCGWKAVAAKRR